MSRKDYQLIAGALAALRHEYAKHERPRVAGERALDELAPRLADALAADNPRFDRDRFIAACGAEE